MKHIMASIQEKLKLKRAPTDIWDVREQLCLASSVLKSGDQNWVSVSRSIKSVADKDSIRPVEWFSQKSCAQQYAYLIENADIPKRKKRESGETTSESIVRRLTQNRISELTKIMNLEREEYHRLKNEINELRNGITPEETLVDMWCALENDEDKKTKVSQVEIPAAVSKTNIENPETKCNDNDEKNKKSSLLTSLLKSPSSQTKQGIETTTIASLLCSSPKVPGSNNFLNQDVTKSNVTCASERLSANAPTLSMLLEQPSQAQKNVQIPNDISTNTEVEKSKNDKASPQSLITSTEYSSKTESLDVFNAEVQQNTTNPIDQVVARSVLDKDEINEIMGDLEELINEEITNSPQQPTAPIQTVPATVLNENLAALVDFSQPKIADRSISPSNSPNSEVSIGEIDSSTSNIAEIIGTTLDSKTEKIDSEDIQKEQESESAKSETLTSADDESKDEKKSENDGIVEKSEEENISNSITIKDEYEFSEKESDSQDEQTKSNCEPKENCETNKQELILSDNKNSPTNDTESPIQNNETEIEQIISSNEMDTQKIITGESSSQEQSSDCKNVKSPKNDSPEAKETIEKVEEIEKECSSDNGSEKEINCSPDSKTVEQSTFFNDEKEVKKSGIPSNNESTLHIEEPVKQKEEPKDDSPKMIKEEIEDNYEQKNTKFDMGTDVTSKEKSELTVEETSDEHPVLNKLGGGKVMKTYSKKQNAAIDYETENESSGETADHRAWKKSIMPVYNSLATHKFASIFLRPITEDQAPGYHSIIFRPMDLYTIKKNIDNGTIRSTKHFQRDVMLMFQNAKMYNKHNTFFHKMTLEMQDECLQHMQVLVRAAGEASFRRETRTGSSNISEAAETSFKRKWAYVGSNSSSSHDQESPRVKKRRKSEND